MLKEIVVKENVKDLIHKLENLEPNGKITCCGSKLRLYVETDDNSVLFDYEDLSKLNGNTSNNEIDELFKILDDLNCAEVSGDAN